MEVRVEEKSIIMHHKLEGVSRVGALSILQEFRDILAIYCQSLKNLALHEVGMPDPRIKSYGLDYNTIFQITSQEVVFEKLKQDSEWLTKMVDESIRSLKINGNLDFLINNIMSRMTCRAEEDEFIRNAHETQEKLIQLRHDIFEEQHVRENKEESLRENLLWLQMEEKALRIKTRAETTYVEELFESRYQQDNMRVEISLERLAKHLERCQQREEAERSVSNNFQRFIRGNIAEYENNADVWLDRHRADAKSYNKEIRRLQQEVEDRRNTLDKLRQEYTCKQEFIDGILAEKEAARKKRELEEQLRRRIIKIQSWWRGLMVRRKLGKFRPEEKKRKRPPKSKKGHRDHVEKCKYTIEKSNLAKRNKEENNKIIVNDN